MANFSDQAKMQTAKSRETIQLQGKNAFWHRLNMFYSLKLVSRIFRFFYSDQPCFDIGEYIWKKMDGCLEAFLPSKKDACLLPSPFRGQSHTFLVSQHEIKFAV